MKISINLHYVYSPTLEDIRCWGESFDKLMKCSGKSSIDYKYKSGLYKYNILSFGFGINKI